MPFLVEYSVASCTQHIEHNQYANFNGLHLNITTKLVEKVAGEEMKRETKHIEYAAGKGFFRLERFWTSRTTLGRNP